MMLRRRVMFLAYAVLKFSAFMIVQSSRGVKRSDEVTVVQRLRSMKRLRLPRPFRGSPPKFRRLEQLFRKLTEARMMQIAPEPIELAEAHDQGAPFLRINPILVVFAQDALGGMHSTMRTSIAFMGARIRGLPTPNS